MFSEPRFDSPAKDETTKHGANDDDRVDTEGGEKAADNWVRLQGQATAERYQRGPRSSCSFKGHTVMSIAIHTNSDAHPYRASRESRKSGCPKEG